MAYTKRDITSDPRTKGAIRDLTSGYEIEDMTSEEGALRSDIGELTDRIETLVNTTGQFRAELLERPDKWVTQIRDLGDENYELVEPLSILVEEYPDDVFIARFPEVEVFGEGITDAEAILDLKNSILDLYDELTETDPNTLGKLPKMWLRILKKVISVQ